MRTQSPFLKLFASCAVIQPPGSTSVGFDYCVLVMCHQFVRAQLKSGGNPAYDRHRGKIASLTALNLNELANRNAGRSGEHFSRQTAFLAEFFDCTPEGAFMEVDVEI